jgi:hypothetical protein
MSGGSTTSTKTDANAAPWKPSQPYLQNAMGEADSLFNAGVGSQVNSTSQVVPFAQQTMQSMQGTQNLANQQQGNLQKPINSYASMIDALNPIARGDFSGDNIFRAGLQNAQDAARQSVDLSASGMGRYGSGTHQATMAKAVGDLTNQAQLDRMAYASNGLQQFGNAMPGAYSTANMGNQSLAQVGGNFEQLMANQIQDQNRIFNETQNAPWDALARYNAIISGAGQLGSKTSQTATTPQTPLYQQAAGFGLSALGGLF